MKSTIPDPDRLDELAAGLDAGWDDEPAAVSPSSAPSETRASQPPHSSPLPEALEALDADWDVAGTAVSPARSQQQRASQTRPSQARPSPTRAVTPAPRMGQAPVRVSKQDLRDAERKRRAHEAQQRTANKQSRKAERLAEARRQSEQLRAKEQLRSEERALRPSKTRTPRDKPKAPPARAAEVQTAPRANEGKRRARREGSRVQAPVTQAARQTASAKTVQPLEQERGATKLIIPFLLALVFALTFYFALSRAR